MATDTKQKRNEASQPKNYKGFVAGVFSGIAKLSGMYFFSKPASSDGSQHAWTDAEFLVRSRPPV